MEWRRIFEPQGLNWWTIVSGIGMNFVLTALLFIGLVYAAANEVGEVIYTLTMTAGGFLIPMFTAYVCGRISGERFMAYAFYPLVGYLILAVPGVLSAGLFGLLMIAFGIMGAFNGANLAARRARRQRHYIEDE